MNVNDPYGLERFISAQAKNYDIALEELKHGDKRSEWIWYVIPQVHGLGESSTAVYYSIKSLEEAKAFLKHPVLGARLIDCFKALLSVEGKTIHDIVGYPDELKVQSSATLFELADPSVPEFREVLEKYYNGERDANTLRIVENL